MGHMLAEISILDFPVADSIQRTTIQRVGPAWLSVGTVPGEPPKQPALPFPRTSTLGIPALRADLSDNPPSLAYFRDADVVKRSGMQHGAGRQSQVLQRSRADERADGVTVHPERREERRERSDDADADADRMVVPRRPVFRIEFLSNGSRLRHQCRQKTNDLRVCFLESCPARARRPTNCERACLAGKPRLQAG